MQISTSRSIMKTTLLIVIYISLAKAMYTSSTKNFLNSVNKVASLENETDSNVNEIISILSVTDINFDIKEDTPILVRKVREADSSDALNKEIDNLRTHITSLSDTIQKGSKVPATGGSTFTRPTSNSKFAMLENEIKKMKEDIQRIKGSSTLADTSRLKLNSLEDAIETLQKLFDDKNREFSSQMENLESYLDRLTGTVGDFRKELNQIKGHIDESERLDNQRALPAEIIQEIKSRNFGTAYQKIQNLNDVNKMNYIVHEVYNNNAGNFDLILQFGDSIRFIQMCFRVYKALNYEMEYNNHDDPFKLIKLIDSLEKEVIKQISTPGALKEEAQTLNNKIKNLLKDVLIRKMKDALRNNNYETISQLCDTIYLSQSALFDEAIKQVTQENFDAIDASDLVRHFESHTYIAQSIYGYSAVFNELRSRSRFNDKVMITIAYGIKNLMQMSTYPLVRFQAQTVAQNLKNALPTSLRNMVFSSRVCIKNIARNEYLYAAGDPYKSDGGRRRVLTWVDGTQVIQGDWIIEPDGNIFYIKNYNHNEYFYAANDDHMYDESRRNVYTWVPGGRVIQGKWTFELSGDNVYIRNDVHGEYLFADSERKLDNGRRHVFTWLYGAKTPDSEWAIVDCS